MSRATLSQHHLPATWLSGHAPKVTEAPEYTSTTKQEFMDPAERKTLQKQNPSPVNPAAGSQCSQVAGRDSEEGASFQLPKKVILSNTKPLLFSPRSV